jgi:hypothetical protein
LLFDAIDGRRDVSDSRPSAEIGESIRQDIGQRCAAQKGHANQGERGKRVELDGVDWHNMRMVQLPQSCGFLVGLDADLQDDLPISQIRLASQEHAGESPSSDFANQHEAGNFIARLRPFGCGTGTEGIRMFIEILVNLQQLQQRCFDVGKTLRKLLRIGGFSGVDPAAELLVGQIHDDRRILLQAGMSFQDRPGVEFVSRFVPGDDFRDQGLGFVRCQINLAGFRKI